MPYVPFVLSANMKFQRDKKYFTLLDAKVIFKIHSDVIDTPHPCPEHVLVLLTIYLNYPPTHSNPHTSPPNKGMSLQGSLPL